MKQKDYIQYLMKETEIAMRLEVMAAPKPGLVDRNNRGSHQDMDLNSFLRSAKVLSPWFGRFMEMAQASPTDLVLPRLRKIGQEAEQAMYQVTGGANTHKGLIFSLGLISACLVRLQMKLNRTPNYKDSVKLQKLICLNSQDLTKELNRDLEIEHKKDLKTEPEPNFNIKVKKAPFPVSQLDLGQKRKKEIRRDVNQTINSEGFSNQPSRPVTSHGEAVYARYGLKGIRQEAEQGFPAVFQVGLPAYGRFLEKYEHQDVVSVLTLLELMIVTDDTNLVKRGGLEGLLFMRAEAARILNLVPDLNQAELIEQLIAFDKAAIEKNLSPGGAADHLAVTIFLYRVLSF